MCEDLCDDFLVGVIGCLGVVVGEYDDVCFEIGKEGCIGWEVEDVVVV